jgi:septal ring factor EnvC (AmiA/AmiB activator)
MTDENTNEIEQVEEPQGETKAKTDWKAEARKWENLAKKGKAAEEELARIKEAQMSELEKANAKAEQAEAELREMKAEAERLQAARQYSQEQGVPLELLEFCKADEMEAFCKAFKAAQTPVHSVATGSFSHINTGGTGKRDPRDAFIAFAEQKFKSQ